MTNANAFNLQEEIALLALKDKKGTFPFDGNFIYAISGAILAELSQRQRIRLEDYKKTARIVPGDSQPVNDPLMDECLSLILSKKKPATLETWIGRLSSLKRLKHRLARQLCQRGVLRADEKQILLFFKRNLYPEIDHEPERVIIERLRQAVLSDSPVMDMRTVQLLSLAHHTGLLKAVFDKSTLKAQRVRIQQIVANEVFGKAVKTVIETEQAASAAVVVCCAAGAA